MKAKVKEKIRKIEAKYWGLIGLLLSSPIYASLDPNAGMDKWDTTMGFFAKWIGRVAGAVLFIGVVSFGWAFKKDDPDSKDKALKAIAGAIIVGSACLSYKFFIE